MTEQEEREAFEEWAGHDMFNSIAWAAWQARSSLAQPVVIEACGGGWATGGAAPPAPVGVDAVQMVRDGYARIFRAEGFSAIDIEKGSMDAKPDFQMTLQVVRAALSAAGITDTSKTLDTIEKHTPCGGCGAASPAQRCIGCLHDFGDASSAWVREIYSADTSKEG